MRAIPEPRECQAMNKALGELLSHFLPHWRKDCRPDAGHPHRRRYTPVYRHKCGIVKSCWIVGGALAAVCNSVSLILALGLTATLLSFVILDETS